MLASKGGPRLWARIAISVQFAALLRILAEYFRLRGIHGQQLGLAEVDVWIESALLTTVLLAAGTFSILCERYRLTVAIGLATVVLLLLFKWYLVSTGGLPGWF